MASLLHLRTGRRVSLSAHTLVGRGPECRLRLEDGVVSTTHAAVRFAGSCWYLRDLGSRNGTWVGGAALEAGQETELTRGTVLGFGVEDDPWVVEDIGPPVAAATRLGQPLRVEARGPLLLLPDAENPDVALLARPDGTWVLDAPDGGVVVDGSIIDAAGARWRLDLPVSLDPTTRPEVRDDRVRFLVSSDEEFVELEIVEGEGSTRLRHRTHNYLLLTLSRLRERDRELPESRRGWVDQTDLARMLQVSHATVNVQLCRARRALGDVREDLGTRIVERRHGVSQLRFGLEPGEIIRI